jgi:hypothetical protein
MGSAFQASGTRPRIIDHGGESVGFLSQNSVYPDSRAAIVVLTNADFSGATDTITEGIEKIVLPSPAVTPVNEATRADMSAPWLRGLLTGA